MAKEEKPIYMKPWIWALAIVLIIAVILWSSYNNFVVLNQNVDGQWAQTQTVLQRRYDLIPNLVETVKGYASQETEIYDSITQARIQYSNSPTAANANAVEGALSRLMAIVEDNPELKSSQNFLALQDQLEGTENRVTTERMRYNDAVRAYNTAIKMFPGNMMAGMFGFGERAYFESVAGAETAPVVDFT